MERPDTRAKLLWGLAEKGFGREQMAEMQKLLDAADSDLFDVLAHVAHALPPLSREERDREKLPPLLKLKYHNAIADAFADLGRPEEIGFMFAGFQKYLYQPWA